MSRIRQSLVWWCFCRGGVDPKQVVTEAKRCGYASIEMGPRDAWPLIKDHGLEIATFVGHQSLGDGMNNPANLTRIEDELNKSLDDAVEFGVHTVLALSGNRKGRSDEEGLDACTTLLNRVKGHAEEAGVTIVTELLDSKVDHPDYQCDRTSWGVELCDRVNSPRIKLLYDIYHMQIMEGDVIRTIRDNIDYIGHFHTAGNPGRRDLDDEQELYYPAVMRAIGQTNYAGFVGHEFTPKGDPLQAMRSAYAICDV